MYNPLDPESQQKQRPQSRSERLAIWIPRVSLFIGLCAFCFQVFVLYPWHIELSNEFDKISAL
jgi:hypothetical protein